MINANLVGRTAGARLVKETKNGKEVNRLFFNVYTKIDKETSQWVTCSCSGNFADKIAPWLMIERETQGESKDKYESRLVNVIGRLQITRKISEKKHQITNSQGEVKLEIDVPFNDTSLIIWIDRCEFLDSASKKESSKKLDKTTSLNDEELDELAALLG